MTTPLQPLSIELQAPEQEAPAARNAPVAAPAYRWSLFQRIAFRFCLVFFGFYTYGLWRSYWLWGMPGAGLYQTAVVKPATWLGKNVWGICPAGAASRYSDLWYCWVNDIIWLTIASAVITLIWSLLDRKRPHYRRLHEVLRVFVRYYLGYIMLLYAFLKWSGMQFSGGYHGTRLTTTVGDLTPRDIMWYTMGVSTIFGNFSALGETVGGMLMFWRRTTTLGALIIIVIMAAVAMLDIVHQVSISERAVTYGLLAAFLLVPDARRLIALYISNQPVDPPPPRPIILNRKRWPALDVFIPILKFVVIVPLIASNLQRISHYLNEFIFIPPRHELVGLYNVAQFSKNGAQVPPRFQDTTRWWLVELQARARDSALSPPGTLQWTPVNTTNMPSAERGASHRVKLDSAQPRMTLLKGYQGDTVAGALRYSWISPGQLRLTGTLERDTLNLILRKLRDDDAVMRGGLGHFLGRFR